MSKGTTKSQGQKHVLDKFYTKPDVALHCIQLLNLTDYSTIIEPSAGSGSFSSQLPSGSIALDLEPEHEDIIEQDFFLYTPAATDGKILVIGNPPFGQQNSLAVRFINHAATFADTVAFIVPRSFDKDSIKKRINKRFHLVSSNALPKAAFTLEGQDYFVPCIFQVWSKGATDRIDVSLSLTTKFFQFTKKDNSPDVSIRRVGGNAGKASANIEVSEQSNYFVTNTSSLTTDELVTYINTLTFPGRDLGVGPRTISKGELIAVFEANAAF